MSDFRDPGPGPAPAEALARLAEVVEGASPSVNDQYGVKAPSNGVPAAAGQVVGAAIYRGYEAARVEAETAGKRLLAALEQLEAEAKTMAEDYGVEVHNTMDRVRADVERALEQIQAHMTSLRERGEQALTFIQSEASRVTSMAAEMRDLVDRHGA
jgi:hypothetical protein